MKGRIYGKSVDINSDDVKAFYEKRFTKENPLASVMARANPNDGVAEKRNGRELALLTHLIDFSDKVSILDIGCGLGRWATNLFNHIKQYDGIDFTQKYIEEAKNIFVDSLHINFTNMSATDITKERFDKKYDLIIINGLFVHLNDSDIIKIFGRLKSIISSGSFLYLRESVSTIGERLTLSNFYSEELKTSYNAVYRTPTEYEEYLSNYLGDFKVVETGFLLSEDTGKREETDQKYWLLQF